MTRLFGITNCDTVKKARQWLEAAGIDYAFADLRGSALTRPLVELWLKTLGAQTLVNNRSTTWRQLSQAEQTLAMTPQATALILANPTLIKRPLLEHAGKLYVGFSEANYAAIFNSAN